MEVDGAENGQKLRRGRISQERKREILEQYDLLSKPCSDADAAAVLGIKPATLSKMLSERCEKKAVVIENASSDVVDEPEVVSPKLKRGRLSYEKQKELLVLYDQLPNCSYSAAASKLGIRETTLLKLLASRRAITSGKRKRKKVDVDSSSESDSSEAPSRVQSASNHRRGPISFERQKELLERYDKFKKPMTTQAAAAELGISPAALAKLLASREAGTARLSPLPSSSRLRRTPQPGSSGLQMNLRKGCRVRVDFSEDEQSGSDYKGSDSSFSETGGAESDNEEERNWNSKETRKCKRYSFAEKEQLLARYDELAPTPQWRAAQILGITQSTLSNWLQQRNFALANSKTKLKYEEDSLSGEEIDCYVLGSTKGTQVVQFFEVNEDKKSKDSGNNDSLTLSRKPHLTLREKYELYKKYDSMDTDSRRNAAALLNVNKSTWFNLIANRYHYEQRFKARLRNDMSILNKYDDLENKKKSFAAKVLNVPTTKLGKLLENRETIEKYFDEIIGSNEDGESIAQSVEEKDSSWKDSKALKNLEMELLRWSKKAKIDQVLNWKVLKEKAKELAVENGMDDFWPSDLWLEKWNKTHRVFWNQKGRLKAIYEFGENRSVSECVLTALKDYPPEDVFNLVETGLYYRAVPGHSPVTSDWVTVTFVCNMSGTEKKRLQVVGRSEAPLRFRVMPLPLVYRHSNLGNMNEDVFCSFLQDWDQELAEADRQVAVILDSSSSHPNVQLMRIRLFFVPVEHTQEQPLSDRIVGHAKAMFRKRMAASLGNLKLANPGKIAIVDALFALAEAWEGVPKSLLVSAFLKSTFPQNDAIEPDKESLNDDEELESLNKLDEEIQLHSTTDELQLKFDDRENNEQYGDRVVHMEGTLRLSEEEEEDFDIDSLLQDTCEFGPDSSINSQKPSSDLGSKLKNFLQKPAATNGSLVEDRKGGSPTVGEVRGALLTIKKFLQFNGCTLEDLTDYTQLEIKVMSKIKSMTAQSQIS